MHTNRSTVPTTDPAGELPPVSFAEALAASGGLPDGLGAGLFLALTTLVRPWELVSAAKVEGGFLHLPEIPCGARRSVPLGYFARCVVGDGPVSLLAALCVRPGAEVDFLARLQHEVHRVLDASLEQLWASAIEAVAGAAGSAPERDAVFAYAGVGPGDGGSGLLGAVPALIDDRVRAAGFE